MTTYISLLRGINVNGQKIIKMNLLKNMFHNLGFEQVITYLQSGNVIFESEEKNVNTLTELIQTRILNEFGFEVPVVVVEKYKLAAIIKNNPFSKHQEKEINALYVSFLGAEAELYDEKNILNKKQDGEEIIFSKHAIYLYCPNGYGKTKLHTTFLESKLKVMITTRNWKTTMELLRLAK